MNLTNQKIKSELKQLSKKLKLNFKDSWFKIVIISKEEEILQEYLRMSSDPKCNKYGRTLNQRIKNLEKFLTSREMEILKKSRRYPGLIMKKEDVLRLIKLDLSNKIFISLKNKLTKFRKIKDYIILEAKEKEEEKEEETEAFLYTLRHECMHVLLRQNLLGWKDYKLPRYCWLTEEGLITYLSFFIDNKLKEIYNYSKQGGRTPKFYGKAGLKWLKILNIKPKKETIERYLKLLSKNKKERECWKNLDKAFKIEDSALN